VTAVLPPAHGCYADRAHVKTKHADNRRTRQPQNLTFRFSRFRTFFSTTVRHCFSVVSLASDVKTLSCCLTQIDGISKNMNQHNHVLTRFAFAMPSAPRQRKQTALCCLRYSCWCNSAEYRADCNGYAGKTRTHQEMR